jgi:hypothetical protein
MAAHAQGAHDYQGRTNSRAQRSLAKARRGLSVQDRLTVERLEELIAQDPPPPQKRP